jgi:hypothetical protein
MREGASSVRGSHSRVGFRFLKEYNLLGKGSLCQPSVIDKLESFLSSLGCFGFGALTKG